jgi:hypothetical protein
MENIDQNIKKYGAQSGLLLGLIFLALTIFSFYFMTSMTNSFYVTVMVGPLLFSVILPLVVAILFCSDLRKKIGGFWTFKQAVTGIFIMFLVGYLVSFAGGMVFSKIIEPNMATKMKSSIISATTSFYEKQGLDQDKIDAAVAKMEKSIDEQSDQSAGKIAKSFGMAIIFLFVFALIFGAVYKREPPLFTTPVDAEETY